MSMLSSVRKSSDNMDEDDAFGKHTAFSLRKIDDVRNKEFAKLKIQEILFKGHDGQLPHVGRVNQTSHLKNNKILSFKYLSFSLFMNE